MDGQVISSYRLVRRIGFGASAELWEGVHTSFEDIQVAIKLLYIDLTRDVDLMHQLKRECRSLQTLLHPNIVGFRELVLCGNRPALIMEWLKGADASEHIQRGPLSPEQVLDIGRDALTALAFAHDAGVIHRNIKPSHLFVCSNGTTKLLSFGGVKREDDSDAAQTGVIKHLAPEVLMGEPFGIQSDLYALGLSLWELLRGYPACPSGDLHVQITWHLRKGIQSVGGDMIPQDMWAVLSKLCAIDPSERYSSASEAFWAFNQSNGT